MENSPLIIKISLMISPLISALIIFGKYEILKIPKPIVILTLILLFVIVISLYILKYNNYQSDFLSAITLLLLFILGGVVIRMFSEMLVKDKSN